MQLQRILNSAEKRKGFVYHAVRWSDNRTARLVSIRRQPATSSRVFHYISSFDSEVRVLSRHLGWRVVSIGICALPKKLSGFR